MGTLLHRIKKDKRKFINVINPIENKVRWSHDAFCTMVRAYLNSDKFVIDDIINSWWYYRFNNYNWEKNKIVHTIVVLRIHLYLEECRINNFQIDTNLETVIKKTWLLAHKFYYHSEHTVEHINKELNKYINCYFSFSN